ncbi:hypothetical protein COCMIDRAFT_89958, partial [Bipolaris oryzae ATCC 44560]
EDTAGERVSTSISTVDILIQKTRENPVFMVLLVNCMQSLSCLSNSISPILSLTRRLHIKPPINPQGL